MNPLWLFDEVIHSGEEFVSEEDVAAYDKKAGKSIEVEQEFIQDLQLNNNSVVVDIGAGTGHFAFEAAKVCRKVYAIDASSAMVKFMKQKQKKLQMDNVFVIESGILTYKHHDVPVDVVVSKNTLHHLPDFWKVEALKTIYNMLKEGGTLWLEDLIFSFPFSDSEAYINKWIDRAQDDPRAGWTKSEFRRHVKEEYSTYTWLMEKMLEEVGFKITDKTTSENKIFASYRCLKR